MRIGILSDTHDNVWKLAEALDRLSQVDMVIHCGDLCSPFVVKRMGEALNGIPVHIVWGNNEGDPFAIAKIASAYENIHLHGPLAKLDLDGFKVGVNHYPEIAEELAASGHFDLVCYGHDHTAHIEKRGDCLLVNPGEVMGLNGRSTVAIFDSESQTAELVEI